jgi:hypothetical protein
VREGGWGWGAAFFDYDNDGDLDLTLTNGVDFPNDEAAYFRSDPQRLWRNEGGSFSEVAEEVGLADRGDGRGLLVLDYDLDGDQDLFVAQHAGSAKLYRNDGGDQLAWLRVELRGHESNRSGIGARVSVVRSRGERAIVREVSGGNHFLGQSELTAHFGLGRLHGEIAELRVRWPSGRESVRHDVPARSTVMVEEPE